MDTEQRGLRSGSMANATSAAIIDDRSKFVSHKSSAYAYYKEGHPLEGEGEASPAAAAIARRRGFQTHRAGPESDPIRNGRAVSVILKIGIVGPK